MDYRELDISLDKSDVLPIAVSAAFTIAAAALPPATALAILFITALFAITFYYDKKTWFPFGTAQCVAANVFAIPLSIAVFRNGLALPLNMLPVFICWWFFVIFSVIKSSGRAVSYSGLAERQFGLVFRMTVPVFLLSGWQFCNVFGLNAIIDVLLLLAVSQSAFIMFQFLVDKKHLKFNFHYKTSMSGRYLGSLSNPIVCANFMVVMTALSFALFQRGYYPLFTIVYLFLLAGLSLCAGRAAMLAHFIVSTMIVAAIVFSGIRLSSALPLIAVTMPLILILLSKRGKSTISRIKRGIGLFRQGTENRQSIWHAALRISRQYPAGVGLEAFGRYARRNLTRKEVQRFARQIIDRAHNIFLDVLVETGVFGFLSFVLIFVLGIYSAFSSGYLFIAFALIAFCIESMFSYAVHSNYIIAMLLASLSAGITATTFPPFIVLLLLPFLAFNLATVSKRLAGLRIALIAVNNEKKGDFMKAAELMRKAILRCPLEEKFYTFYAIYLNSLMVTGKVQDLKPLAAYEEIFNMSSNFIENNCTAPDFSFAAMAKVFTSIRGKDGKAIFANKGLLLARQALQLNPNSAMAYEAVLMVYAAMKDRNGYVATLREILADIDNGAGIPEFDREKITELIEANTKG